MADNDTVQARIISSVFSRKNAAGQLAETYVSHIKIWEDADAATRKPRYILLSQTSAGTGYIHKSKLNTNGTFSVGKTWNLPELRGIQVLNPVEFNITLSRTYRWTTENEVDQVHFIDAMIKLYRSISNNAPLRLDGVNESLPSSPRISPEAEARQAYLSMKVAETQQASLRRISTKAVEAQQVSLPRISMKAAEAQQASHCPPMFRMGLELLGLGRPPRLRIKIAVLRSIQSKGGLR